MFASNAKRRAIKKSSVHKEHDNEKEKFLFSISTSHGLAVDHIVPLSRGGFHWHENLRLLPHLLNTQKGNKLDEELSDDMKEKVLFWSFFSNEVWKSY